MVSRSFLFLFLVSIAFKLQAQMLIPAQEQPPPRYLARIEVHTIAELNKLLTRAEQLFNSGNFNPGIDTPVAFILHGSEARSLLTPHYLQNKELVDLAARLSAFKVVEIKVCKTWMEGQSLDEELLPPFIATVPFGPAEERRLMQKQHYVYF